MIGLFNVSNLVWIVFVSRPGKCIFINALATGDFFLSEKNDEIEGWRITRLQDDGTKSKRKGKSNNLTVPFVDQGLLLWTIKTIILSLDLPSKRAQVARQNVHYYGEKKLRSDENFHVGSILVEIEVAVQLLTIRPRYLSNFATHQWPMCATKSELHNLMTCVRSWIVRSCVVISIPTKNWANMKIFSDFPIFSAQ